MIYIAEAAKGNGGALNLGGRYPGDQDGTEVITTALWWNKKNGTQWNSYYRCTNEKAREYIAACAEQCANNQHIGYDQDDRWTLTDTMSSLGWPAPNNLITNVDTDCSALVSCCCKYAGYNLGISALQNITAGMTTSIEREVLTNSGIFTVTDISQSTYGTHEWANNLIRGDILLMGGHTAVVIQNTTAQITTETPDSNPIGFSMWMSWSFFESGYEYTDPKGLYILGGTGNGGYGRYGFHVDYGLVPFMEFCVDHDSTKYSGFQTYIDMGVGASALWNNEALHSLFKSYAETYTEDFQWCQDQCMLTQYYEPARQRLINTFNIDVESVGTYMPGVMASLSIRFGSYVEITSEGKETLLYKAFKNAAGLNEEAMIKLVYSVADTYYGTDTDEGRWHDNDSYSQYRRTFADINANAGIYQIEDGYLNSPQNPGLQKEKENLNSNPTIHPTIGTPESGQSGGSALWLALKFLPTGGLFTTSNKPHLVTKIIRRRKV